MTQVYTVSRTRPVIQPRPIGDGELFARAEHACAEARQLIVEHRALIHHAKAYAEDQRVLADARMENARPAVRRFREFRGSERR